MSMIEQCVKEKLASERRLAYLTAVASKIENPADILRDPEEKKPALSADAAWDALG